MDRALRKFLAAVAVGLLLVVGWMAITVIIAQTGQETVKQVTDAPAPPVKDFYDADLFRTLAPYLFISGFLGTLLEPAKRRR